MKKEFTFSYEQLSSFEELSMTQQATIKAAEQAYNQAYAPYSKFKVGAALYLDDNSLIQGSNQENKAYPSGLCAERVALFSYGATKRSVPIKHIGIVGGGKMLQPDELFSPCGACRQVMVEYTSLQGKPFEIILKNPDSTYTIFQGVHQLLPFAFGEK